jgi:hypothetical protein
VEYTDKTAKREEKYERLSAGESGSIFRCREKPDFPLQFLSPPAADLRDFRYNSLRPTGFCA